MFFLKFQKMELSSPKIKKSLYFSKKAFLIFQETKLFKRTFYISRGNFQSSKNKKNLLWKIFWYFGKWNFLASSLKNSYISWGNLQILKIKHLYLFSDFLFVETKLFKHKCKRKKFLILSLTHMQNFLN